MRLSMWGSTSLLTVKLCSKCMTDPVPVEQRIHYKLLLQVYRALTVWPQATLLSCCRNTCHAGSYARPRGIFWLYHHPARRGATSFHRAAPQLWNSLRASVRRSPSLPAFKTYLKTPLYLTADWWLLTLLLLFLFLLCTAPRAHREMALLEKLCIIIIVIIIIIIILRILIKYIVSLREIVIESRYWI